MAKRQTEKTIRDIADLPYHNIRNRIEHMLDYISVVSRYSYRNRRYATDAFLDWIVEQNVKDTYESELKQKGK